LTYLVIALYHEQGFTGDSILPVSRGCRNPAFVREKLSNIPNFIHARYKMQKVALALREDRDERVEEIVEEMLAQLWRDIDGKRN
jgi:hypothetical protein